MRLVFQMISR